MMVATNPLLTLVGLTAVIALLLVLIAKWRWHVFLALLVPILLFGIIPGVQQNNFIKAFETGFGKTLGQIGVIIVLGSIIAEALKHPRILEVSEHKPNCMPMGDNGHIELTEKIA